MSGINGVGQIRLPDTMRLVVLPTCARCTSLAPYCLCGIRKLPRTRKEQE